MTPKRLLIGMVVLVAVWAIGWYFFGIQTPAISPTTAVTPPPPASQTPPPTDTANTAPKGVTVTYTDSGFSPKSVSVSAGSTVTFVNNTSHSMWVASAQHPSHQGYDGTSKNEHCVAGYTGAKPFDECTAVGSGASWSFTFDKAGTWPYHDHVNAGAFGMVVVTGVSAGVNAGI